MKWYFLSILLVTVLSIVGLLMVALRFDPFNSSILIKGLFVGSLSIALWGMGTFLFSIPNMKKGHGGRDNFLTSFRRGFLFSAAVSLGIILGRLKIFNVLSVVLIAGVVLMIELLINKKNKEKEYLQDFN